MELLNLSGLEFSIMKNENCSQDACTFTEIDDTYQRQPDESQVKDSTNLTSMSLDSYTDSPEEISSTVIDRSPSGNECKISYIFNKNTKNIIGLLEKHKIPFETEIYKPKDKRQVVDSNIFYCKNLFLKDRKGQFYLVICHEEYNMDLKQLRKTLNASRNFNFGTAGDMMAILGTEPGGVTPLALMNPNAGNVKMVIHKSLIKEDAFLMFHPLDLNLATKITLPSLLRYLKSCNHNVTFVK